MDTIFARASAAGRAGVAIVRVSGADALGAATRLCGPLPEAGRKLCRVRGADGLPIDDALILTFKAGASFTGEAVAEFHLHGSPAVISATLHELSCIPGLREAEPGEFTRRALENGRLDLAQVEGLADLIDAETEAQRRQALRLFHGGLSSKVELWREKALQIMALIEASIDFADEELPDGLEEQVSVSLDDLISELSTELVGFTAAERVREGFEIAIIGPPNSGKSTLLNRIAGREAAIISTRAGTTRDVIEVRIDIGGIPATLLDTAGLRESEDEIETLGIARARRRAGSADLCVILQMPDEDLVLEARADDIVLYAKGDIEGCPHPNVSGLTGTGVNQLLDAISEKLERRVAGAGLASHLRHRTAIENSIAALKRGQLLISSGGGIEEVAEDVRQAMRSIDSLIGRVDVEDVLGKIFQSFCIGK